MFVSFIRFFQGLIKKLVVSRLELKWRPYDGVEEGRRRTIKKRININFVLFEIKCISCLIEYHYERITNFKHS